MTTISLRTGNGHWTTLIGVLACLLLVRYVFQKRIPKGLRLPPGPPGKFILGNISDMPTHHGWKTFAHWAKVYGNLVHMKMLNRHIVIVNSADIAHELFEKRSTLYSDRFHSPMVHDLMGSGWVITSMHYGDKWRRHRRAFNQKFHASATVMYHDVQIKQTRVFLQRLHESPQNLTSHIRHLLGAIIMEITYGIHVLPERDPYLETAEAAMAAWAEAGKSGPFLVDTFPILKCVPAWVPGAGFQKKACAWRIPITKVPAAPFDAVKRRLAAGTAQPSVLTSLLEELSAISDAPPDQEEIIRNAAGVAYLGGTDTMVSAISSFFLAMILYPEVQRKARKELDTVIGIDRLPTFEDRPHLPYIAAVCKEVLRWHPVVPLGIAHSVTQHDVYNGIFIPGGSIIMGNAWAMLHDENAFGLEPEKFIPERFLEPGVRDPAYAYGFGRRICPGRHLANNSIFIAVASTLKVFDITHASDDKGDEIPVKDDVTSGMVSYPEAFRCALRLRAGITARDLFERCD